MSKATNSEEAAVEGDRSRTRKARLDHEGPTSVTFDPPEPPVTDVQVTFDKQPGDEGSGLRRLVAYSYKLRVFPSDRDDKAEHDIYFEDIGECTWASTSGQMIDLFVRNQAWRVYCPSDKDAASLKAAIDEGMKRGPRFAAADSDSRL